MTGHTAAIYEGTPGTLVRRPHLHLRGSTAEALVDTALAEVADGADRVELCGGVGIIEAAAVRAAVPATTPVGVVRYGFESLELAAGFKQAFLSVGEPVGRQVFCYPDAEGSRLDHLDATVLAVPDAASVGEALRTLQAEAPLGLVELYGGLGLEAAGVAWAATRGRAPVGFVDGLG